MGMCIIVATWMSAASLGGSIPQDDVKHQNEVFQRYWGTDFVWKFDDLPTTGTLPRERVPYSGHIYLDRHGGTTSALRKYDRAFHPGRMSATAYEQWDTTAFQEPIRRRGWFAFGSRMGTPGWYGHCNGWTAAAIRHAEPQQSVTRNGVVFSPADVKALLAEIYMYNDNIDLSGASDNIQAGLFHAVVANWIGRGRHPLGIEADPGREKWNYPAYSYSSSSAKRSDRQVEVKLNLAYAKDTQGEYQESPRLQRIKYFHYRLDLNANGEIVGGTYYGDSSRIDMLWVPVQPKLSGKPGNERGNPHVDVRQVLSIWRESVPAELRSHWLVIDPPAEDRVTEIAKQKRLVPVQNVEAAKAAAATAKAGPAAPAADASGAATSAATAGAAAEPASQPPAAGGT